MVFYHSFGSQNPWLHRPQSNGIPNTLKMKMLMRHLDQWGPHAVLVGHENDHDNRFNFYLGTMLWSDYHSIRNCNELIEALNGVKHSADENAESYLHYNAWFVTIRKAGVHIVFAPNEDQEDTFPLEQVLHAATGWLALLKMPASPESQVIVDL